MPREPEEIVETAEDLRSELEKLTDEELFHLCRVGKQELLVMLCKMTGALREIREVNEFVALVASCPDDAHEQPQEYLALALLGLREKARQLIGEWDDYEDFAADWPQSNTTH